MAETFPGSLQDKFNSAQFNYALGETKIVSDMDVGPPKMRRRFTKAFDVIRGSIDLDYSDFQTLKDFHDTTLDGGTKLFEFTDAFSGVTKNYRFIKAPSLSPKGSGGLNFTVSFEWEVQP